MRRFLIFTLCCLFLAGCANLSSLLPTPEPVTVSPSSSDGTSTDIPAPNNVTATPTTVSTATPGGPHVLRIWVPPQFDPSADTPAAKLLQQRLDDFVKRRPGLQIEVRVKAESGTDNLVDALSATRAAAPSVAPDLIALSRADMANAADKGLLHPLDGLTTIQDDPDWYAYALQVAHVQNTTFGLPFAGDALVLVGYADVLPANWLQLEKNTFIFPAADPKASFSLALYLSTGSTLVDQQGQPALDTTSMEDVLSFYLQSATDDLLPHNAVDYQSDDDSWQAFRERRANLVVTWASRYLQTQGANLNLAPLTGITNSQYSLATGWSWALSGSNPDNQNLAVELAEFLSDSQFLAEWTQAAGYVPTRPTALASWTDARAKFFLGQAAESAHLIPSQDLVNTVGPLFAEATLSVLNGEKMPAQAVQSAVEQLK